MKEDPLNKILIVDDNRDIVEVTTIILDLEDYEVDGIFNGTDVPDKISSFQPELILLDVMLGDRDGREICHEIKSNPKTAHIGVIMISASHDLGKMDEKYCKPDGMISKPFDIQFLIETVNNYFKKQKRDIF
jgi:DNA-binding response OmpR family regulator